MNTNDDNTARELAGVILGRHYENYDNSYYREDLDVTAQRIAVALRNAREDERAAIEMREQLPALLTDLQNDDKRLAEIRERCEKATAGPWFYRQGGYNKTGIPKIYAHETIDDYVAHVGAGSETAQFIAHARSDIPYLLEKITALNDSWAKALKIAGPATPEDGRTLVNFFQSQITALESKLAEADRRALNAPDKCPITQLPFFMAIEHPDLGVVPTYGGPFDSYTIPQLCDPKEKQPWHEIEMDRWRYDHDVGGWTEMESIPIRLIHEDVLNDLLDTQTELSTLRRQVEEARKDTERLDLLERLVGKHGFHDFGFAVERYNTTNRKEKLREAIDTALQQLAQRGGGGE